MNGLLESNPHSCTLRSVIFERRVFSGNQDGMTCSCIFRVHSIFLGKFFSNVNEIAFGQVGFDYSNLREWLNNPTISIQNHGQEEVATIHRPTAIKGCIDSLFDFEIRIVNVGFYPEKSFNIHLEQSVFFVIVSKNGTTVNLDKYLQLNKITKYFFMFLQGRYVIEKSIYCNNESNHTHVDYVGFYIPYKPAKKINKMEHFQHSYDQLTFEKWLQKWVKMYGEMPDFFDRFYENVIKEELSPIDKFENLIQSLLFYHKSRFDNTVMPRKDYNIFFNNILDKLDADEKKFIEKFRTMGNNISMRNLLKDIVKKIDGDNDNTNRFIDEIVLLRNKIEHSTENTTSDTLPLVSSLTYNLSNLVLQLIRYEISHDNPSATSS